MGKTILIKFTTERQITMKCASCGAELVPGAKFCDACGAPAENKIIEDAEEPAFVRKYTNAPQSEPPAPEIIQPVSPSSTPSASGGKILGIDASQFGIITLILGIAGLLLSCVGCGGLISIVGIVAGVMGLKNSANRQMTIIGLVLSGLGLIVTLIFVCLFVFYLSSGNSSGSYYF
jgi:hypothetical protein